MGKKTWHWWNLVQTSARVRCLNTTFGESARTRVPCSSFCTGTTKMLRSEWCPCPSAEPEHQVWTGPVLCWLFSGHSSVGLEYLLISIIKLCQNEQFITVLFGGFPFYYEHIRTCWLVLEYSLFTGIVVCRLIVDLFYPQFVREKIVDMSELEFEEWFNAKFPQPQRCVSAPPARTSGFRH